MKQPLDRIGRAAEPSAPQSTHQQNTLPINLLTILAAAGCLGKKEGPGDQRAGIMKQAQSLEK